MLSESTIATVRETLEVFLKDANAAARAIYGRFTDIHPEIAGLFKGDMTSQGRHLTDMIFASVMMLDDPEGLRLSLEELGLRHQRYGVRHSDYRPFEDAFLWSLENRLGSAFTPTVKAAWIETFRYLTMLMTSTYTK